MKDWREDFNLRWEEKSASERRERREERMLRLTLIASASAIIAIVIATISAHNEIKWIITSVSQWFKK